MTKFPFNVGDRVIIGDEQGFITFIDTAYFTLCVREWEDKDKLHGTGQVNVLIYRKDWKNVRRV
tara:strand:+ start:1085 stop:1276 length:192 start_codon:yes stop_codon:yes gene_type:complete